MHRLVIKTIWIVHSELAFCCHGTWMLTLQLSFQRTTSGPEPGDCSAVALQHCCSDECFRGEMLPLWAIQSVHLLYIYGLDLHYATCRPTPANLFVMEEPVDIEGKLMEVCSLEIRSTSCHETNTAVLIPKGLILYEASCSLNVVWSLPSFQNISSSPWPTPLHVILINKQ